MQQVTIDKTMLHALVARGASLMGIYLDKQKYGYNKRPSIKGWQSLDKLPIDTHAKIEQSTYQGYGLRPIDAGVWVLDIDEKNGKSGSASLAPLLGYPEWLDYPDSLGTLWVEAPNGRHYYFLADGLPQSMLNHAGTAFGNIEGIDIRCARSGWIMAPGSLGYSHNRGELVPYIAHGETPKRAPQALIDLLVSRHEETKKPRPETRIDESVPDYLQIYSGATGFEEITDEDKGLFNELFKIANELEHSDDGLSKMLPILYPEAEWKDDRWHMGDIQGHKATKAGTCYISASQGCGDWATNYKSDLIGMLCEARGIDTVAAARLMLAAAGVPDPSQRILKSEGDAVPFVATPEPIDPDTRHYALTQFGNRDRLTARMADNYRYNDSAKSWMYWTGKAWENDNGTRLATLGNEVIKKIKMEASLYSDSKAKESVMAWAKASQTAGQVKSMLELVQADARLHLKNDAFEKRLNVLNCENGMVDLRSGNLAPHDKASYFLRYSPVKYNPGAQCPRFLAFLSEIMLAHEAQRASLIEWLQVFFGYCLTGEVSEHIVAFFYGTGRNGKSALMEIIRGILSPNSETGYFGAMRPESLMESKGSAMDSYSLAAAYGCRLVVASESNPKAYMSVSRLKEIAGGDSISCRNLYQNFFTYVPTWKLVLLTNHKPNIPTQDEGTWRRIRCIPFDLTVQNPNKRLAAEILEEEAEGILAWMVAGAVRWYESGLPECRMIEDFTNEYRDSQDSLNDFFQECCVIKEGAHVEASKLFGAYKRWSEAQGDNTERFTQTAFGRRMGDRKGITKGRSDNPSSRVKVYYGIGLLEDQHDPQDAPSWMHD